MSSTSLSLAKSWRGALLCGGLVVCLIVAFGGLGRRLPRSTATDNKATATLTALQGKHHGPAAAAAQQQHPLPHGHRAPRLAILLPFVGNEWPVYAGLFCTTAVGMSNVADVFLIYTAGTEEDVAPAIPQPCRTASNIKMVPFPSTRQLMQFIVTKLLEHLEKEDDDETSKKWALPEKEFIDFMAKHTEQYPYTLVEYKPAFGHIFAEYIPTNVYSHWAYSDWDIMWGDVGRHLSVSDWTDYDIVTWGFGDQRRLYLRGQFTMHQNDPVRINQLWQGCDYLYRIDERYSRMLHDKDSAEFKLESAEGCYSAAVLKDTTLSIKYTTAAWTDVNTTDTASRSGVYIVRDTATRKHLLIKRDDSDDHIAGIPAIGSYASLAGSPLYGDETLPWLEPVGAMQPIALPHANNDKDDPCQFFWIRPIYRSALCLPTNVNPDETLYWVKGQLYKQAVRPMTVQTGLSTGPLFHFQEWKRHYQPHHLTAVMDPMWSSLLLTREGGIPVQYDDTGTGAAGIRKRVSHTHVRAAPLTWQGSWDGAGLLSGGSSKRHDKLPDVPYCLQPYVQDHGHLTCEDTVYWSDTARINLLTSASAWKAVDVEAEVTLTLTLVLKDLDKVESFVKLMQSNLDNWQGQPAVIVIALPLASNTQIEEVLDDIEEGFEPYDATAFVAVILPSLPDEENEAEPPEYMVSRKTLLNMAVDLCPTRWYISGLELERGLVLNRDSVVLALRAVGTSVQAGRALWLGQYALHGDHAAGLHAHTVSLRELALAKTQSAVQPAWQLDEPCENENDETDSPLAALNTLWWSLSSTLLEPDKASTSRAEIIVRATRAEEINREILSQPLAYTTESPILLLDNAGPYSGVRTHTLVREPESLYGLGCASALQLTLLLAAGYQVDVLEGAFAVSTPETRINALACEGCVAWKGHEKKKDETMQMELRRLVNTAIVWENPPIE